MSESQKHGFIFEELAKKSPLLIEYYKNKFLVKNVEIHETKYNGKWDSIIKSDIEDKSLSVKSFKYTSPNTKIEFASISNIFNIQNDFILIIIGYEQEEDIKKVVLSDILHIQKEHLDIFKGKLDIEIVNDLCENITKFEQGEHLVAREWAKKQKELYNGNTMFDIRFKIDSKTQRRIQCALSIKDIYEVIGKEFSLENKLNIENIYSSKRKRKN
jgi:hypothetical protein